MSCKLTKWLGYVFELSNQLDHISDQIDKEKWVYSWLWQFLNDGK